MHNWKDFALGYLLQLETIVDVYGFGFRQEIQWGNQQIHLKGWCHGTLSKGCELNMNFIFDVKIKR